MGTNFYTNKHRHIGKRSAAGLYCWDCRTTLCKQGESEIHGEYGEWHTSCPKCGKSPTNESLSTSTAGLELGFAKPYKDNERVGVKSTSSFRWDIKPNELKRIRIIKDEYGRKYKLSEFIDKVLANCPIQYIDSIGQNFS